MTTTFDRFAETVISEMRAMLPGYDVTAVNVTKVNDTVLRGLTVRQPGSSSAPTLYLDSVYENHLQGESISDIVKGLINIIMSAPDAPMTADDMDSLRFENIRDKLTVRLIDTELNHNYLQDHPCREIGAGLALIAEVDLGNGYRFVITNNIAEQYDLDEVFNTALSNMELRHPAKMISLSSAIFGGSGNILEGEAEADAMSVLTGDGAEVFGGAVIAYSNTSELIRKALGANYYLLPSSQHEFIIVEESDSIDLESLKDMVVTANMTVVDASDKLSDSVFYYSGADKELHRVA